MYILTSLLWVIGIAVAGIAFRLLWHFTPWRDILIGLAFFALTIWGAHHAKSDTLPAVEPTQHERASEATAYWVYKIGIDDPTGRLIDSQIYGPFPSRQAAKADCQGRGFVCDDVFAIDAMPQDWLAQGRMRPCTPAEYPTAPMCLSFALWAYARGELAMVQTLQQQAQQTEQAWQAIQQQAQQAQLVAQPAAQPAPAQVKAQVKVQVQHEREDIYKKALEELLKTPALTPLGN